MKYIITFLFIISSLPTIAHAEYKGIYEKQAARESSHWTLEGWINQRDKSRLMDLWLNLHSPSPFEFYVNLAQNSYLLKNDSIGLNESHVSYAAGFAAYASFVGLEFNTENNSQEQFNDGSIQLNFRILGPALQSTHLIIGLGQRSRESIDLSILRQQFTQADLQVYFMKYFGIEGNYRQYNDTVHETLGKIQEYSSYVGLFIDFSFLRVYGGSYKDSVNEATIRTGTRAGLKIFF